jgi:hypothetical protein
MAVAIQIDFQGKEGCARREVSRAMFWRFLSKPLITPNSPAKGSE